MLWDELPCSRRLVIEEAAGPSTSTPWSRSRTRCPTTSEEPDAGVVAFLEALDAGERGPGYSAWERSSPMRSGCSPPMAPRAQGFDTVRRGRRRRGELPELVAARAHVRPRGARPRHGPKPNGSANGSRTNVGSSAWSWPARGAAWSSRAPTPIPTPTSSRPEPVRRRDRGLGGPRRPPDRSTNRCRPARPERRGDGGSPIRPRPRWRRLAALDGLVALGRRAAALVVPARLDRHRHGPCTRRSTSRTRACPTWRRASSCTCSATSSASADPAATTPGSARRCTGSSRRSRKARSPRTRSPS